MSAVCLARPQNGVDERGQPLFWDSAYQFAYAVASPEYGDYHGHQQSMDEYGHTSGSYYLLGADGQWSQTIYADKGLGYQTVYNQRPAGAPPPQVSEVTYQVFVHPGATAISAQGSAPPPPSAQPFGGIRQQSLVDPNVAQQQGRRINREIVNSQIHPIGDSTIDAAFAPYYESSNAVQPENVYSPRFSRKAEASPVIFIEEQEPVSEPYYSSSDYDVQHETVYPQSSRQAESSPVFFIEEQEPAPESDYSSSDYEVQSAEESDEVEYSRFEREPSTRKGKEYIEEQEPVPEPYKSSPIDLQIPGAVTKN